MHARHTLAQVLLLFPSRKGLHLEMMEDYMKSLETHAMIYIIMLFFVSSACYAASQDLVAVGKAGKTIEDTDGKVSVTLEWLTRPGEFALNIEYFGYLTQEGPVNLFLLVNGVKREFLTLKEEMPNRHQRIRLISFHPTTSKAGPNALVKLAKHEVVDYLLFKNAPYYSQFGEVKIEMKFFAHGRWDGDGNRGNENYRFSFKNPMKDSNAISQF